MAGWIILSCCSPQILSRANVFPIFYCPVLRAYVNGCLTFQSQAGRSGPGVISRCCSPSPSRCCVLFRDAVLHSVVVRLPHADKDLPSTQLPLWVVSLNRAKPSSFPGPAPTTRPRSKSLKSLFFLILLLSLNFSKFVLTATCRQLIDSSSVCIWGEWQLCYLFQKPAVCQRACIR